MSGGVYTDLERLIDLQYHAEIMGPSHISTDHVGSHLATLRGRGLDFDELKTYVPGDDVRHMDWRVTGRTGRAFVRSFKEEKESVVHLILDQSISLFFGSQGQMKSVAAAEITAHLGWWAIGRGDRIALTLMNDSEIQAGKAGRSIPAWITDLKRIETFNRRLRAGLGGDPKQMSRLLQQLLGTRPHQRVFYIVSDLNGFDLEVGQLLQTLAQKNEVRWVLVFDPLEKTLPQGMGLPVSDGERQLMFDTSNESDLKAYQKQFEDKYLALSDLCEQNRSGKIGFISVSCTEPLDPQLRVLNPLRLGL